MGRRCTYAVGARAGVDEPSDKEAIVSEVLEASVQLGVIVSTVFERRYRDGGDERFISDNTGGKSATLEYLEIVLE